VRDALSLELVLVMCQYEIAMSIGGLVLGRSRLRGVPACT
jgi:hypothetical protein